MPEILAELTQGCGAVALTFAACLLIIVIALCFAGGERRSDLLEALRILCRHQDDSPSPSKSTREPGGHHLKVVYKITYPNEKIYVGMDVTGTMLYFGSPDKRLIQQDFTLEEQRDFSVRKEILWESETATDSEVRQIEIGFIRQLRANDPIIGYNRSPRFCPRLSENSSASTSGRVSPRNRDGCPSYSSLKQEGFASGCPILGAKWERAGTVRCCAAVVKCCQSGCAYFAYLRKRALLHHLSSEWRGSGRRGRRFNRPGQR